MRKLKVKLLVIVSICVLIIVTLMSLERIELVYTYLRLVSNEDIHQRLILDTPTEILESDDLSSRMSVGYAEFHYPFGDITKIYSSLTTVKIESEICKMYLSNIVDYDKPIGKEKVLDLLRDGTMGMWRMEQLVKVPPRFRDLELRIDTIQWMDPYAFKQRLMASKPQSLGQVSYVLSWIISTT